MASDKEEIIFELKVEPGDGITELEKLKKSIVQTKQEQAELNKAFKAGNITLDEYAQDSVRLESILKKQQSTYNNVQKSVTGVKTQLDKLIDSNQKISNDLQKTSQSFQDVASNINIAGVNVGSLSNKLSSFVNPATAAIGIVSALGKAYASSTIGAKDLEFAQSQLSITANLISNSFAGLISSAEDGKGLFSIITDEILNRYLPAFATISKNLALGDQQLEDLGRSELEVRDKVNQRLEENQELLTDIQSDQTKYNDKLDKSNLIITNIRRNEEELSSVLNEELKLIQNKLAFDKENEELQTIELQKKREISNVERDAEKRVQAIVRLQNNLNESEKKRLQNAENNRFGKLKIEPELQQDQALQQEKENIDFINNYEINANDKKLENIREATEVTEEEITEFKKREAKKRERIANIQAQAEAEAAASVLYALSGIFKQGSDLQKAFALTAIGIDTAEAIAALTASSEGNPANAVTFGAAGIAQYAAGIVRILTNIATAEQYINKAAGGGEFMTKGPTMLMVGDNPGGIERVTVEPISGKGKTIVSPNSNLIAMAGGGSLTTGDPASIFSIQQLSEQANVNKMLSRNIAKQMKNMPAPVVSVKEINRIQTRVKVKENIARANKGQ